MKTRAAFMALGALVAGVLLTGCDDDDRSCEDTAARVADNRGVTGASLVLSAPRPPAPPRPANPAPARPANPAGPLNPANPANPANPLNPLNPLNPANPLNPEESGC
ncbi:hypothetical protein AB0C69_21285 [Actinomadura sp. NPDC048032]|uniref:hypothetical protein n=1 Tax=Actinomadura sp. NPDC048032 TaxID=3155747 RepID=UPI0033D09A2C